MSKLLYIKASPREERSFSITVADAFVDGYKGLVTGKRVFIAYARGGEYVPGTEAEAFDFQTKYFETILGFMGLTDVETVVIEPTLMDPDSANEKGKVAITKAKGVAQSF